MDSSAHAIGSHSPSIAVPRTAQSTETHSAGASLLKRCRESNDTHATPRVSEQHPNKRLACSTDPLKAHLYAILKPHTEGVQQVTIDGDSISADSLHAISKGAKVALHTNALQKMEATANVVAKAAQSDTPVYGINTGFGLNSNIKISKENTAELQKRILRSHATGVGEIVPPNTVRRMMALRINTLAKGHSGIRPTVVQSLVDLLNSGCTPKVKMQGTVGASGDLVPLAHIGLALLGEGDIYDPKTNTFDPAHEVLARYDLSPVELTAKEGLCLINGTQFMAAIASEAFDKSANCFRSAFPITGMSLVAMTGHTSVFDPRVSDVRPHPGQTLSSDLMRLVTPEGGSRVTQSDPQDPYSLRCVPQVYGPIAEALASILKSLEIEWNSSTDNPLVFLVSEGSSADNLRSAGNFHGNILGLKCDEMAMHLSQLSSIAYPRISNLLDPNKSRGLTAFLAGDPGLDSGLMTYENVAASLLSEIKAQSNPASVDSIPTCAQKEDHVAMGGYAARKAVDVATNTEKVLAVELLVATQAIHQRRKADPHFPLPPVLNRLFSITAELSPPLSKDRHTEKEFDALLNLVQTGAVWRVMSDSPESTTLTPPNGLLPIPLNDEGFLLSTHPREGETRFGQLVGQFPTAEKTLNSPEAVGNYVSDIVSAQPKTLFTLDASQDDFGARANLGRGNTHASAPTAWDAFLDKFANIPINRDNTMLLNRIHLLGSLNLTDLTSVEANSSTPNQAELCQQVEAVHKRAADMVKSIFTAAPNSQLAYLNGDHNNMRALVTGFHQATGTKPVVVYLDLHADCRPETPGPHSGNWHTALQEAGLIEHAYLVGMNPMSNNQTTVDNLSKYQIDYKDFSWPALLDAGKTVADSAQEIVKDIHERYDGKPVIVSICGDSVSLLPASAGNTVVGYDANSVYRFINTLSSLDVRALNIAELKPSLSPNGAAATAEFLTQALYCFGREHA